MKPEEKHLSFSIERFEDVSKAFEDVGGPKSGIKLTGEDHAIWVDYSKASKETMQQFERALLKHTIKSTLKTKGVAIVQVCCLLTVLGALLKGCHTGLDYLTSPCKTKIQNENGLPQIQKITDQKKSPAQDTSRGAREN
jgi:hypothetical protein